MTIATSTITLVPASPADRVVVMLHNPSIVAGEYFYVKLHNSDTAPTLTATDCIERIDAGETKSYQVGKSVRVYVFQATGGNRTLCVQEGY
jgi:hypothetical protein